MFPFSTDYKTTTPMEPMFKTFNTLFGTNPEYVQQLQDRIVNLETKLSLVIDLLKTNAETTEDIIAVLDAHDEILDNHQSDINSILEEFHG